MMTMRRLAAILIALAALAFAVGPAQPASAGVEWQTIPSMVTFNFTAHAIPLNTYITAGDPTDTMSAKPCLLKARLGNFNSGYGQVLYHSGECSTYGIAVWVAIPNSGGAILRNPQPTNQMCALGSNSWVAYCAQQPDSSIWAQLGTGNIVQIRVWGCTRFANRCWSNTWDPFPG